MSVAVIIPNRNNEAYLDQCLGSIADDPAVAEILIFDDASTDSSVAVVERFESAKVKLLRGHEPIGATRARHELILQTDQPYLSFLDADDFLAARTISQCFERAVADRLDMSIPEQVKVSPDGLHRTAFLAAPDRIISGDEALIANVGRWQIGAPRGVVSRQVYLAASDGFDFYGYSDDELLTRRMLLACERIGGAKGVYYYRFDGQEPSLDSKVARLFTSIKSLGLARSVGQPTWDGTLRAHRNHAVMQVIRLAARYPRSKIPLTKLFREIDELDIAWAARDIPLRLIVRLFSGRP